MPSESAASVQIDRDVLLTLIKAGRIGQSSMNDAEARAKRKRDPVIESAAAESATATNWAVRHAVAAIAGVNAADVTAVVKAMRDLGIET